MIDKIDSNRRADPVLNKTNYVSSETIKRVVSLALPFVSLNPKTGSIVSVGMGIHHSWNILTDLAQCYRERNWGECGKHAFLLTVVVSSTGLAIIFPIGQFVITNSFQCATHMYHLARHLSQREWKEAGKDTLRLLHVSIYIASVLIPGPEQLALSLSIQALVEVAQAYREYSEHGLNRLPEVIAGLLLATLRARSALPHLQTVHRNYLGKQLKQEDWEGFCRGIEEKKFNLSCAQKREPKPHVESSLAKKGISTQSKRTDFKKTAELLNHRNHFDNQLEQKNWKGFDENIEEKLFNFFCAENGELQSPIDIESLLIKHGISSRIKGIDFTKTADLSNLCFKNIQFQNCNFHGVEFERSVFHNISANSCLFDHSTWINSVVTSSHFSDCDFTDSSIVRSFLEKTSFFNTDLRFSCFNDSILNYSSFKNCKMLETSFLGAEVKKGLLIESDLTDCLLLDTKDNFEIENCTPNQITRPIVGIGWNFKDNGTFTPLINESLRYNGTIPLHFECEPKDIDPDLLEKEIQIQISEIKGKNAGEMLSIPDEILKRAEPGSEVSKIQDKAATYIKHMNGLSIPGGEDVHPEFYGAVKDSRTDTDDDYRRSIMEFAMISLALKDKIPTMGTCRGSQMINVYRGGTLKQHVGGQNRFQKMKIVDSPYKKWMKNLVGYRDGFIGLSMHHQASERMGKGLEVVLKVKDITKLFLSRDGLIIGSQLHPEIHPIFKKLIGEKKLDHNFKLQTIIENNQNLYRYFVGMCCAQAAAKRAYPAS